MLHRIWTWQMPQCGGRVETWKDRIPMRQMHHCHGGHGETMMRLSKSRHRGTKLFLNAGGLEKNPQRKILVDQKTYHRSPCQHQGGTVSEGGIVGERLQYESLHLNKSHLLQKSLLLTIHIGRKRRSVRECRRKRCPRRSRLLNLSHVGIGKRSSASALQRPPNQHLPHSKRWKKRPNQRKRKKSSLMSLQVAKSTSGQCLWKQLVSV
jgi:hypothetical protein